MLNEFKFNLVESSQSITLHLEEKATETPAITSIVEGAVSIQQEQPEPLDWEEVESEEKWSCSQCTFLNHPCLDTCEICSMPRIKFSQGMSSSPGNVQILCYKCVFQNNNR